MCACSLQFVEMNDETNKILTKYLDVHKKRFAYFILYLVYHFAIFRYEAVGVAKKKKTINKMGLMKELM